MWTKFTKLHYFSLTYVSSILHFYYRHLLVFCIILFYYLVKKLQNTRNFVKLTLIAFFFIIFTSYVDPNSILIIKQTCHLCIVAHVIMYVSFLLHVGDQMNEIVTNVTALSSWISFNVNVQLPLLVGIVTVLSSCIAFSNCRG